MGSAIIPTQRVDSIEIGSTSISNPLLLLKVDGIVYSNGYRIAYNAGYRNIFPGYNSSNQKIYLYCHNIAYGEDLPQISLTNVEVLIIG